VIETAAAMAEKFVAQSMDEAAQDRLFAETLRELEGAV
jgi:F0F1-type ATP synthase membrane subunit b/b'